MKSLFENLNFLKLFFVISVTLFSSVSLSENSNTIKESIISVDDLIDTYNSSDSTNKAVIDKASIQDFISEEPYYILMDNLLVGALTDALNFIGLDMDTPSSSRPQSQNAYKEFSDASMVLIYIIKAAWGVGMLIFAFVFGKFLFRAVFEGASSGEFGSKDSPLAMWDIARLSFIALLVPTDISSNSAIQVPLIVHLIIIAIAISLVLVAIFMITVANFTFLDLTIVPENNPFKNIITGVDKAQEPTDPKVLLRQYKLDFHKNIFTKYDANIDNRRSIIAFETKKDNIQRRYPASQSFLDSPTDMAFLDNEELYAQYLKDINSSSTMTTEDKEDAEKFKEMLILNRKLFLGYLNGLRGCMSALIKSPRTSFTVVDKPTLVSGDIQLYKESSLRVMNFNPEKINIYKTTVTSNKGRLKDFTDYKKALDGCLHKEAEVNVFMHNTSEEIKSLTNTHAFNWWNRVSGDNNEHYAFLAKIRLAIKKSVDSFVNKEYRNLLHTHRRPLASYTLYGTREDLKNYGIEIEPKISPYIITNFDPPENQIFKIQDEYKFYSESNISSILSENKESKFTSIITKIGQMDKKAYDDALKFKKKKSPDSISPICSNNTEMRMLSDLLASNENNNKYPTLCASMDDIIANFSTNSPEVINGVGSCNNAEFFGGGSIKQKACQAKMAPLTAMSPNAEGSPSNFILKTNSALVLARAATKSAQINSGYNDSIGITAYGNKYTSLDPVVEKLQGFARIPLIVVISYKATIFAMFLFALFILMANTIKNIVIAPMWAASLTKQSQQEGVAGDQLHGFKEILYIILYPSILLISIMITFYSLSFIISVLYEMVIGNNFFITHQLEYFLSFLPGSSSTWIQPIISWISSMVAYLVFYVLMFLITIRTFKWMFIMPYKIMKSVGISTNQMNRNMMKEMMSVSK